MARTVVVLGFIGALFVFPLVVGCDGGGAATGGEGGSGGGGGSGGEGGGGGAGPVDLRGQLEAIAGMKVVDEGPKTPQGQLLMLELEQPADHADPDGQKLTQRLSLLHRDPAAPMVLGSTGYQLSTYEMEPTALLDANQLIVEHRFFTPSRPEPADWRTLRIEQAAADHHRVVEALRPLYSGKWLSTGASKGGMTSVYHRRFYPADVDATIAYVAPHSYGDADPRYIAFLDSVGEAPCREALELFQVEVLLRRAEMTARMIAKDGESAYSIHGVDGALDYAVIELAFAFWQYGDESQCDAIPGSAATDDEVWQFLEAVNEPVFWADESFETYEPYYFQAAVELGYPGIDDGHLAGLLTVGLGADVASAQVAPGPTKEMMLDAGAMPDIADWLSAEGERMLFVYGESDPYSAAAFEVGGAKESYRFFAPGQNHGVQISDLPDADRAAAMGAIEAWVGVMPKVLQAARLAPEREARLSRGRVAGEPRSLGSPGVTFRREACIRHAFDRRAAIWVR